jgi:hypothetical protein
VRDAKGGTATTTGAGMYGKTTKPGPKIGGEPKKIRDAYDKQQNGGGKR